MPRKILVDTDELYGDVKLWRLLGDRGVFFYQRLWGLAERWGGFNPDVERIALDTLALKCSPEEAIGYLRKLYDTGKIAFYSTGRKYVGYIRAYSLWNKGLRHPPQPDLPLPDGIKYNNDKRKYEMDEVKIEAFLEANSVPFDVVCTLG